MVPRWLKLFGPGLVTGASDDDPSGIATYAQVGARFRFGMLWTMVFSYPLMFGIQETAARIGRVTGRGIAGNLRQGYPRWLLYVLVGLLVVANTINIGADIAAMGEAAQLVVGGGSALLFAAGFALTSLLLQMFLPYRQYSRFLIVLTLSLFAYVVTVAVVKVPWAEVARAVVLPRITWSTDYLVGIVAVLGTTISPYLFFWQASQEVEETRSDPQSEPLLRAPWQGKTQLRRVRVDTLVGMAVSNLIAFSIILTTAVTLGGTSDVKSAADAAAALKPLAGSLASLVFAAGIIGTGMLAVPVLGGAAAYAVGEALQARVGLEKKPHEAKLFYGVLAAATVVGLLLNLIGMNPMKALVYAAVVNGVVAVPVMTMMMLLGRNAKLMGRFTLPPVLHVLGWFATAVMAAAVVAMFLTLGG